MSKNQQNNTNAFLREYNLLRDLRKAHDDAGMEHDAATDRISGVADPFDPFPRDGEIRLLANTDKLTYAVVYPWDWSHALVIPFSHSENPANQFEFYAENAETNALYRKVYQVWNSFLINRGILAESWIMDTVSDADMRRLQKMIHYQLHGGDLPAELTDLNAEPVSADNDIRHSYLREERANMLPLAKENLRFETLCQQLGPDSGSNALVFDPAYELQAAAGDEIRSNLYCRREHNAVFLAAAELENFRPVPAGSVIPHFVWFLSTLPEACRPGMPIIVKHKTSGVIIGSALLRKSPDDGWEIIMGNVLEGAEVPQINSPGELQLFISEI